MYAINRSSLPTLEQIEDFGLTPNQFRIYHRLLRLAEDGIVCASAEELAAACKMNRMTVLRTLSQLEKLGLIECDRVAGRKNVFVLQPINFWQTQNVVVEINSKSTSNSGNLPTRLNKLLVTQSSGLVQGEVSTEPLKGVPVDTPPEPVQPVTETSQLICVTGSVESEDRSTTNNLVEFAKALSLDEKLEAARKMGLNAGIGYTELNQKVVRVDGKQVSEQEFIERSLDSFVDQFRPATEDELASCRAQIEKIKARKAAKFAYNQL